MTKVRLIAWVLKIGGTLYLVMTIPYIVEYMRFEVPQNANHLLVLLQQPMNTVTAVVHGLGAIALGMIQEKLAPGQADKQER